MMYTFITYTISFSSSHNMICSLLAITLIPCSIILQTLLANPFIPLMATLVRCTLLTYTETMAFQVALDQDNTT